MPIQIEKLGYGGWPNCYSVSNGEVDLIVTGDIGPRIMRFGFRGEQNFFKEFAETLGRTNETEWVIRGGHRLWTAPELQPRTYAPDNSPVEVDIHGGTLTATQPVEPTTGIEKKIIIDLAPSGTRVRVTHRLRNTLAWAVELAPWALSIMAQNGIAITGFPPRGKHPDVLPPSNPLVMWAFTDLTDPRWIFTKKYLILRQDPSCSEPTKLGHFNPHTWGAYLLNGALFLKQTFNDPAKTYPDLGCSFETFTRNDMLELETLGPLQRIEPGASAEHTEYWSLHKPAALDNFSDTELDRLILPLLEWKPN